MNLLTDAWIPVQHQGSYQKISLQQLLCGEQSGELCLPRDDMELACLQLLCAMTQVLFIPRDKKALGQYIREPITPEAYADACRGKMDWFDLDHPETPFMQIRGVKAAQPTTMDKLLAGVADGTNKAFVNPQGLAEVLCGGCVAIALFNAANNCPSMGGGFKGGLRGSTPITVLIKGRTLRETVWLNVLTEETAESSMPWYQATKNQLPNYLDRIKADAKIPVSALGLNRGLLWQPAHFEIEPSQGSANCSCCGCYEPVYNGFNKAKFNYTIDGVWPHPLSARIFAIKKGEREEKFPSFTTTAPTWTHMSRLVVDKQDEKEGQQTAPVIQQARTFMAADRIQLIIGGYRNNQATILERRHELFSLAQGWAEHGDVIQQIIDDGLAYKTALRKALYLFAAGIKDKVNGSGVNLCDPVESAYYQCTENLVHNSLAAVKFEAPQEELQELNAQLKAIVTNLFNQATEPYRQEPKMLKALALARRSLHKSLKELEPQGEAHE
ncbi:type I-E CRISPR-associated protein Cse1/CasA [Methylobacter sp. BlB1]|jgi:CRISPR system Cascade subunit CasA|uniref:type I-E CRISPR-associated protein Cse1/CasA n=1 Tax=Methylobacter sp. BlB1 TaxID=2785914 RepID=UPI001893D740|nr:type I-E CRISPR-associated protein Cse1/CasA [Methylobacter sp. BlB1]MBF6649271.1 type I-E CRISPR-associated protein Cse1/CasA [Methylobacter sp. BlB1]